MLRRRGGPALVALLAAAAVGVPVRAQEREERPRGSYILSRADPPGIDAGHLPAEAVPHYERMRRLRARIERLQARAWKPEPEQLERARQRRIEARDALYAVLRARRRQLEAEAWLLYGLAASERAAESYVTAMDAYQAALRSWGEDIGPEPELNQSDALQAFRYAAARARAGRIAVWARYFEAHVLLQMRRDGAADAALRTVAAAGGPHRLVVEACFRLGDQAFDRGAWTIASRWYGCALARPPRELKTLALYKLAWSRWLRGADGAALQAIRRLPEDAPELLAADADRLIAIIESDDRP